MEFTTVCRICGEQLAKYHTRPYELRAVRAEIRQDEYRCPGLIKQSIFLYGAHFGGRYGAKLFAAKPDESKSELIARVFKGSTGRRLIYSVTLKSGDACFCVDEDVLDRRLEALMCNDIPGLVLHDADSYCEEHARKYDYRCPAKECNGTLQSVWSEQSMNLQSTDPQRFMLQNYPWLVLHEVPAGRRAGNQ